MLSITKEFEVHLAHTVLDAYTSKCDRRRGGIHGHTYKIQITLKGEVQKDGMLMDFKKVKELAHDFIDAFDHSLLIYDGDAELAFFGPLLSRRTILVPYNATAENMTAHIHKFLMLRLNLPIERVRVYETPTAFAEIVTPRAPSRSYSNYPENWRKLDLEKVWYSQAISKDWTELSTSLMQVEETKTLRRKSKPSLILTLNDFEVV